MCRMGRNAECRSNPKFRTYNAQTLGVLEGLADCVGMNISRHEVLLMQAVVSGIPGDSSG